MLLNNVRTPQLSCFLSQTGLVYMRVHSSLLRGLIIFQSFALGIFLVQMLRTSQTPSDRYYFDTSIATEKLCENVSVCLWSCTRYGDQQCFVLGQYPHCTYTQ